MSNVGESVQTSLGLLDPAYEGRPPSFQLISDCPLYRRLDRLQDRYSYADESSFFANLVNASAAHSQPLHRWARYREGFSPKLVHELIKRSNLDPSRHFVVDPMCGSGTTLVAANEEGFDALGCDVNPYAVDLTNAKTLKYSPTDIEELRKLLLAVHSELERYPLQGEADLRRYFPPKNLDELLGIRQAIQRVSSPAAFSLARMAWLSIIEESSNRKKDGNGLATTICRVTDVRSLFVAKLQTFVADIQSAQTPNRGKGQALECSALSCDVAAKSFELETGKKAGTVIFSPPYANSFDYFESYKLELLLGEYCDSESLAAKRASAVRNYRICYGYELQSTYDLVEMTCEEIMSAVPEKEQLTGKRDARTRIVPNLLRGYFEDMQKVLRSTYDSLETGGKCYVVVDQSAYVGIVVATDLLLADLGEQIGYDVQLISKCRRANTSGQQLKRFPYLRDYLRESIVTFSKA